MEENENIATIENLKLDRNEVLENDENSSVGDETNQNLTDAKGETNSFEVNKISNNSSCETKGLNANTESKFKSNDALEKSYKELQSEFTRKCQELKRFKDEAIREQTKLTTQTGIATDSHNNLSDSKNDLPYKDNINLKTLSDNLFKKHDFSSQYRLEIAQKMLDNEKYEKSEAGIKDAMLDILKDKVLDIDNLIIKDEFINNKILNNENVMSKIINNYVKTVQTKDIPQFITKSTNVKTFKNDKPMNLSQAKEMALKMMQS